MTNIKKKQAKKSGSTAQTSPAPEAVGISPELQKLSKPAQRALLANGIRSAKDLSQWTRADVAKFHGVGPSSFPVLENAMKGAGVKFRS